MKASPHCLQFLVARLVACVLCGLLMADASAQPPPVASITAISPDPARRLAPGQNLFVRIAYESDQPLHFQAHGYYQGKRNDRLRMNASAPHPTGKGESLAFVFGDPGARIDEVRVIVSDASWQPLLELSAPVTAEWHAGVPEAAVAPWAAELTAAQTRMVDENLRRPIPPKTWREKILSPLIAVFVPLAFLSVPGYPLLQLYAFWKLRGPWRLLSALPLSFMLPIYAFSLYALSQNSNLWPVYAIFASPVALVFTLVAVIVARRRQARSI